MGFPFPTRNRRRGERPLVSARHSSLRVRVLQGKGGDAFSFSGVPSHAYVLGRMLFLSAWHCGFVHPKGGGGLNTGQGWAGSRLGSGRGAAFVLLEQ